MLFGGESSFQNSRDNGCYAAAVPIITQNAAQSLKPVGVAYAFQKLVRAVLVNYDGGDFFGETTHSAR
jgi:hypothetical protein